MIREEYLIAAADRITHKILAPHTTLPEHGYRVSVGFPKGARSAIAVCWKKEASKDGVCEIFVSPTIDDSYTVLTALTHELIHWLDNCESGHQGLFARVALAVGFARPLTQLNAEQNSLDFELALLEIIDELGHIPHAALDAGKSGRKKQPTRLLKVECSDCGFHFRTSQTQIDKLHEYSNCPVCHSPLKAPG